jgi:hypothetical protein
LPNATLLKRWRASKSCLHSSRTLGSKPSMSHAQEGLVRIFSYSFSCQFTTFLLP